MASDPLALTWENLADSTRDALAGKLCGLYGGSNDQQVFDSLASDRQQALLLLNQRFVELRLWQAVRSVTNIYGIGGVGMDLVAWPMLRALLGRRRDFTTAYAGHRNNEGGFRERRKERGPSLHIVMVSIAESRWAAHFDLYNPLFSPLEAWRHIYHEGLRHRLPTWRQIGGPLRN